MDMEEIKKLIDLMNENDLIEVELEENGHKVRLRKGGDTREVLALPPTAFTGAMPADPRGMAAPQTTEEDLKQAGVREINSPMVGTFYRSSSPEADAYVVIGDQVTETTVVCIIEAMKVMNEIQAEREGEIIDILVENGEAIEFGQPLFLIRPSGEEAA